MKKLAALVLALILMRAGSPAQIDWSGEASMQFLQSGESTSPRTIDAGRPTFGWRSDLFLDAMIGENVAVLSNFRVTDEERLFFDDFALRIMHLTPADLNLQAGKFDMPFGNLGERRFPRENPLYSLPLLYEYQTSLPDYSASENQMIAARGTGSGLRMLDGGIYDIGVELFGSLGILTYAVALSNGTVSTPAYGNLNTNSDLGKVLRLTVTPTAGLTFGAAYASGAYLYEPSQPSPMSEDASKYQEKSGELDLAFSREHFVFHGEAAFTTWRFPLDTHDENLGAFGFYAEGKYTVMPRLYAALRLSGLRFQNALLKGVEQPWDFNVTEWEGGVGYFVDRDVLVKVVRRETRTFGGTHPNDHLTVVQLAASF